MRRRGRTTVRASAAVSRARLAGALVMLLAAGALDYLTTAPDFALDPTAVRLQGLRYTDPQAALSQMGLAGGAGPNLFRLATSDLEVALEGLPAVRHATVAAQLPDRLVVTVEERTPILVWRRGGSVLLADVEGVLFAPSAGDALPAIDDLRSARPGLEVGQRLDQLDLDVARLLGAVTPADLGSIADGLAVSVGDRDGWALAVRAGWRAVFGHYTPELRPPSLIEGQLACLRGLLAAGEAQIASVTLALSDDRCGTYRPVEAPGPPSPEPTGGGSRRP